MPDGDGTRLRVRVRPRARRTGILGPHGGALKIAVSAPAERGKANRATSELLASVLGIPASSVVVVAGESSPDKTIRIALGPAEVAVRLGLARVR